MVEEGKMEQRGRGERGFCKYLGGEYKYKYLRFLSNTF